MSLRSFFIVAPLVVVLAFLGYRVVDLQHDVDVLKRQVRELKVARTRADDTAASASTSSYVQEQRITALEQRTAGLKNDAKGLLGAGAAMPDPKADAKILSVVERENSRLRDIHLEWSRPRWIELRDAELKDFARKNNLSEAQTASVKNALEREVDAMIAVMKRPNVLEDPDSLIHDWQGLLEDTDASVRRVLNPAQLAVWDQVRVFERKVFWPWLDSAQK